MKKFISGLIIGLVLATATSVTAAGGILAQFADFNLVINGQAKVLQTKPLVYNGNILSACTRDGKPGRVRCHL